MVQTSHQNSLGNITLAVLFLGFLIDCLYQTMLAPVLPELLYDMHHPNESLIVAKGLWKARSKAAAYRFSMMANETKNSDMQGETPEIGILISIKAIVQITATPAVALLPAKFGYDRVLFAGFIILTASSLIFSFGISYVVLILAKMIHGLSSACIRVSGFGKIGKYYSGGKRDTILGLVLGGVITGECVGLIYGGFAYEWLGKFFTFLIIAGVSFFGGILHMLSMNNDIPVNAEGQPIVQKLKIRTLLKDPIVMYLAGCSFCGNVQFSMLQTCLPLHMVKIMNASQWETGVVFTPQSVTYLFAVIFVPTVLQRTGRWTSLSLGLIMTACSFLMLAFARTFVDFLLPIGLAGLATGMIDLATLAELGYISDMKYFSEHAKMYSINEFALWIGFAIGPLISGMLTNIMGFEGLMVGSAVVCVLYMLLIIIIRSTSRESFEQMKLLGHMNTANKKQPNIFVNDTSASK